MKSIISSDRRAERGSDLPVIEAIPGMMPRGKAWLVTLAGLALTGTLDAVTSKDLWFGPFYLFAIGFSAWMLGRREALAVGFAAFAATLVVNGAHLYPFGGIAVAWNATMRVIAVLAFIAMLGRVRESYMREWRLARTDPLTGALNRQAFFELASRTQVSRTWGMLVYADLDGLKKLNDERGHAVGDQCLRDFVDGVRGAIRRQDLFARLGGDEFVIAMKVRDQAAAIAVARRLHRAMNAAAQAAEPHLRCSVGALVVPPGARTIDREVIAADELMYEAKRVGAGLSIATLRQLRGQPYLLQHQANDAAPNPVLEEGLAALARDDLDTAA